MMDLVKKNMVSIIAGAVALLAMGAIFWPVQGYFDELRTKAEARARVYGELDGLLKKHRSWPNVSLMEGAEVKPLEVYPTKPIIDKGQELVDQIKSESGAMYKTAWESFNKKAELVPGSLPDATAAGKGRFVEQYRIAVEMNKPETRMNSPLVKILKAGFPPHPDQINARKLQLREEVFRRAVRGAGGVIINQSDLDDEYKLLEARIPIELRRKAADESLIYLYGNSLDAYAPIITAPAGSSFEASQIWMAQVGYWIQDDVCRSLAFANEGATNVMDSPVKQLVKIAVSAPNAFKSLNVGQPAAPASGKLDPAVKPPENYLSSITGRFACPIYDVVPFNLQLVVDATRVQLVLQSLARNKFVTVTTCSIDAEDVSNMEAQGFFMGARPIVRMNMNCEALLFREWTTPLMPPSIRRGLGLPEAEQPK